MRSFAFLAALFLAGAAQAQQQDAPLVMTVPPGGDFIGELNEAVQQANRGTPVIVRASGTYLVMNMQQLPPLRAGSLTLEPAPEVFGGQAPPPLLVAMSEGRLLRVEGGTLRVSGYGFQSFLASTPGGVFSLTGGEARIADSILLGAQAPQGGALSMGRQARVHVERVAFLGNLASEFACDIDVDGGELEIRSSSFVSPLCPSNAIDVPAGLVRIVSSTFLCSVACINAVATTLIRGSIFALDGPGRAGKAICNDFGSGQISSLGGNIFADGSCPGGSGDLVNTDPMLAPPDENGVVALMEGSPAIEFGGAELVDGELPCGYKDARGLGRPQDNDGDGVFSCDVGSYELQSGLKVGGAQSAVYFDPDRSGEGIFLEILPGDQAFIGVFSYGPDGGIAWFVGVGEVTGNSAVFDQVLQPKGGVFGAGFDPAAIKLEPVGGMSVVFPGCEALAFPGLLIFDGQAGGFSDVITKSSRLSQLLRCDGAQPNPQTGRSGSFFDPERSGEGIFVQILDDNRVVVIWYTYDDEGNQFWTINDTQATSFEGNRITTSMLYAAGTSEFGPDFDPAEVELVPWGELVLEYDGCDAVLLSWDSTVPGFGSGSYDYERLTSLAGVSCEL